MAFYTLYGHLDRDSLDGLTIGQPIRAGDRFAAIGAPPENGDWWPHVHFQIITDMLDVPCNFNGVAPASQRGTWLSLSPDPNLLLGIPRRVSLDASARPTLLTMRRRAFRRRTCACHTAIAPLQIVRGWMQYLFDEAGRTYIDAYNNVPHVGHAHPRVTAAVAAQLATLNTNTRYLHETVVDLRCGARRVLSRRRSRCASSPRRAAKPTSWRFAWRARTRGGAIWSSWTPRITGTRPRSSTSARTSTPGQEARARPSGCTPRRFRMSTEEGTRLMTPRRGRSTRGRSAP